MSNTACQMKNTDCESNPICNTIEIIFSYGKGINKLWKGKW